MDDEHLRWESEAADHTVEVVDRRVHLRPVDRADPSTARAFGRPDTPFGIERKTHVALGEQRLDFACLRRERRSARLEVEDHVHGVGPGGIDPGLELRRRELVRIVAVGTGRRRRNGGDDLEGRARPGGRTARTARRRPSTVRRPQPRLVLRARRASRIQGGRTAPRRALLEANHRRDRVDRGAPPVSSPLPGRRSPLPKWLRRWSQRLQRFRALQPSRRSCGVSSAVQRADSSRREDGRPSRSSR